MSSGKWRPSCPGLNVLKEWEGTRIMTEDSIPWPAGDMPYCNLQTCTLLAPKQVLVTYQVELCVEYCWITFPSTILWPLSPVFQKAISYLKFLIPFFSLTLYVCLLCTNFKWRCTVPLPWILTLKFGLVSGQLQPELFLYNMIILLQNTHKRQSIAHQSRQGMEFLVS